MGKTGHVMSICVHGVPYRLVTNGPTDRRSAPPMPRGLFRHRASLLMPWPWFLSRSSIDERDWSRSAMRRWPCWYGFAWLLLTNNSTPRSRTTSARWMAGESDRTSFRSSAKCALFTMSGINFQIHFSSHQSFFRFTSLRSCQPVFFQHLTVTSSI